MEDRTDDKAPGGEIPEAHKPTADNANNLPPNGQHASPDPMHASPSPEAIKARDTGMARVLGATSLEDRAAIAAAVLRGLDPFEPRRTEDAMAHAGYVWPSTAPRRSLGAIVSSLARAGLIVESGWTKGRSGPSHAGRVSLWVKATQ